MRLIADRSWLTGLLMNCPFGFRVNNCPFMDMEALPLPVKIELLEKMEQYDMTKNIQHHMDCFRRREKSCL